MHDHVRAPSLDGECVVVLVQHVPVETKSEFHANYPMLLDVVPEIIEDTNEVAIKISGRKLTQLPGFVVGFGNDLRLRRLPLCEEFVHFSLALKIEPEKDRAHVAVAFSK